MSVTGLNALVGQAVISDRFRTGLLNGRRAELIRQPEFELDPDEANAVMAIQADNLADFSVAVEVLVDRLARRQAPASQAVFFGPIRWRSSATTGVSIQQRI
jgi:hypothetical protein